MPPFSQLVGSQPPASPPDDPFAAQRKALLDYAEIVTKHTGPYTQILLGAGYAGFFAVWAGARDFIGPRVRVWTGLMISMSLVSFIAFEVFRVFMHSLDIRASIRVANSGDYIAAVRAYALSNKRRAPVINVLWMLSLCFSIVPGFGAAGILMTTFVLWLLRHP